MGLPMMPSAQQVMGPPPALTNMPSFNLPMSPSMLPGLPPPAVSLPPAGHAQAPAPAQSPSVQPNNDFASVLRMLEAIGKGMETLGARTGQVADGSASSLQLLSGKLDEIQMQQQVLYTMLLPIIMYVYQQQDPAGVLNMLRDKFSRGEAKQQLDQITSAGKA